MVKPANWNEISMPPHEKSMPDSALAGMLFELLRSMVFENRRFKVYGDQGRSFVVVELVVESDGRRSSTFITTDGYLVFPAGRAGEYIVELLGLRVSEDESGPQDDSPNSDDDVLRWHRL